MAKKASRSLGFHFVHVAQDAVAYQLMSTTNDIRFDALGKPSRETVSVMAYRLDGTTRTPIPVNSQSGAEHNVCLHIGKDSSESAAFTASTSASALSAATWARFDLVAKSAGTRYSESDVLATLPVFIQRDGIDGEPGAKTETVFIRNETKPAKPTGGSYSNPIPTSKVGTKSWSDGVPAGTEPVWMSTARFLPTTTNQTGWSDPTPANNSVGVEMIWCEGETYVDPSDDHPYTDGIADWRTTPTEKSVWMAVSLKNNGAWEDWKITRIKGENPVTVQIEPKVVQMKRGTYKVYVDVYDGGVRVPYSKAEYSAVNDDASKWVIQNVLRWNFGNESGRFYYSFSYVSDGEVNTDVNVIVTYKGNQYPVTIPLRSVADGTDGKDATVYRLIINPTQVRYDLNAQTYDTSSIVCSVLKIKGDAVSTVTASAEGLTLTYALYQDGVKKDEKTCAGSVSLSKTRYSRIDFILKKGSVEIARESTSVVCDGQNGTNGKNGVWVPPPMLWEDYDQNYTFQCGNVDKGETRLDMVLIRNDGNLFAFRCTETHVKKNGLAPSANGNKYWEKADFGVFKFLATDLLWANIGQINFLSGQAFRVGDSSGMCGYFGVPTGGAIFYSGGDNVSNATYVVYANGRMRVGSADGQRIEIDPTSKRMLVYDAEGELCAIHSGDMLDYKAIGSSTGSSTATATQANMQKTLVGAKTEYLNIVSNQKAAGDGTLTVSTPKFVIRTDGTSIADPDSFSASCQLVAEVLFGSEVVDRYILGGLVESSQSYTAEAFSFSLNVPKDTVYSVRLRYVGNLDASGRSYFTAQGNATVALNVRNKVCHYGANGWFVSVDNQNYSYSLYDSSGRMHQKTTSNGSVMFDTDTAGKHF